MNPLLADDPHPPFERLRPEHVLPAIDRRLTEFQALVERLEQCREPSWDGVFAPLEDAQERLDRVWSTVSQLHHVRDDAAWREVYGVALERITAFETALMQNQALYALISRYSLGGEYATLDSTRRRRVQEWLRDFRLGGVALAEPARSRFKALVQESAQLERAFEEAVMDATEVWTRPLAPSELDGLPEHARALLAEQATEQGMSGHLLTLHYPCYQAVMTHATDRALRAEVYRAYGTRASERFLDGRYDNGPRMARLLELRHQAAVLLGYPSAAHRSLATKMAPSPERVLEFLTDLAARARPAAERELAELARLAASAFGLERLEPWDLAFVSEQLKRRRFGLDEEALRPYFPLPRVLDGLFAITRALFGIDAIERAGVPTWHPDVRYFELWRAERPIAGFYLDPYARARKRGGAWMDVCRTRVRRAGVVEPPIAYLNCNFAPPSGGRPALLTHDDVLTLLHEFGHGLHHMLTEVDVPGLAGIEGVEWDAVELPSQFMENFAWTAAGLGVLSAHVDTGAPLPPAWVEQLQGLRHFGAALQLLRQIEFALFDFRLHLEYDPARGARIMETLAEVRRSVALVHPPEWHRFPHGFGHVFGGGYAAGYYSYLWAELLAADAYAAFAERGVFDAETGERFRREVLAVGGSRPALESFRAFRGRDPRPEPLLESYGIA
jgi:oligopeptidase A